MQILRPETAQDEQRMAWRFPPPEPVELSAEEREELADAVVQTYRVGIDMRKRYNENHLKYEQMHRGMVNEFNPRIGPWEGSANYHIQAPFWVIDALLTRLNQGIWSTVPLVAGIYQDGADREIAKNSAARIEWHLQPPRSDARSVYSHASLTRLIHGVGYMLVSPGYAKQRMNVYVEAGDEALRDGRGRALLDGDGGIIEKGGKLIKRVERTKFHGVTYHPLDFDDVVVPVGALNLQPNGPENPGGAIHVQVRLPEPLSLMKKLSGHTYPYMFDNGRDVAWWKEHAPPQDLSGDQVDNNRRDKQQDAMEGINRSFAEAHRSTMPKNPDFEIITHYGPWPVYDEFDKETREEECVIFVCRKPKVLLGVFRLSDVLFSGRRPIVDWHFKPVPGRYYSMGVCELIWSLSNEIDAMHNMRIDVGMATNMPWYFYRDTSSFNPDEHKLRPLKGVPISNPNDVKIPTFQNVTSFYMQEEQNLLAHIERIFGISDLFLGVSPGGGAAARHATGFVGTQQEGMARIGEVLAQDAVSFSQMCRLTYEFDMQYGPEERNFRLHGSSAEESEYNLKAEDLWFRGEYDFRPGAAVGQWSQQAQEAVAQSVMQLAGQSPLTNQDMSRRWEVEARYYRALRIPEAEIEAIIGPKSALPQGEPKSQETENTEMVQGKYGRRPAPTHPSDNDMEHMRKITELLSSGAYEALGRPNEEAIVQHAVLHQQQMQQKQQAQQMQQMQAMQQGQPGPGGQQPFNRQGQGADPMNRAMAQIGPMGAGGAPPAPQGGNGQAAPGAFPSFLNGAR